VTVNVRSWQERDAAHLIHPVTPPRAMTEHGARVIVAGDGAWITDDRGRRIIDGFAGLWCVAVGHGREEIVAAVHEQMRTLEYFTTFHGQSHPRAIELAERLVGLFPPEWGMGHVMFSSGGSEANETNFKIVRSYWALRGEPRRTTIIARHHGYHGLTIATMTATGIQPMRWNFGPEAPGFRHVAAPYCFRCELDLTYPECGLACAKALEHAIETEGPETVAAFVVEPVIGAGGIIPPPEGYLPAVREICDRYGVLLIADEVVTGFGRTGTMFGLQNWGVRPDIVTLAKGLTSGYLPLGASVVSEQVWSTIAEGLPDQMPFSHGYTYSGHPVCCAAALANIDVIERDDLAANAARVGEHLMARLRELEGFESVGEVRGKGLMIGVELVADRATRRGFSQPHSACERVEHEAWERGLYARAMGTEVVGLAPPLTIDTAVADRMVEILADSIAAMEAALLPAERARAARRSEHRIGSPADLFAAMAQRFDQGRAAGVDLTVRFHLTGPGGGSWLVTVRDGTLSVEQDPDEEAVADVTIRSGADDYLRIVNGELSGADAFSTRRLVVDGDLARAAALAELGLV
jgi:adenosylmethionine-8-amino-7-oxononanoate aminotransferase/putative sterol carrier protein